MNTETAVNIIGTLIIFAIIGGLGFTDYHFEKYKCKRQAEVLNYKYEYSYWAKCVVVKPNGKKILLKQLRDFNEE